MKNRNYCADFDPRATELELTRGDKLDRKRQQRTHDKRDLRAEVDAYYAGA